MADILHPEPGELLELLADSNTLQSMHAVAEQTDSRRTFDHFLVEALAARAFGSDDVPAVSLGAQLQEVASDFVPFEIGTKVVHFPMGLYPNTSSQARDIFLDLIPGFMNATNIRTIVTAAGERHYRSERNRSRLLAGAALSHALLISRRSNNAA